MTEVLYGRNPIYECLRASRRRVYGLYVAHGAQAKGSLAQALDLARARGIPVHRVERAHLDRVVQGANHQGIAAEVEPYPYATVDEILLLARQRDQSPWTLILDCLQDPQNLGTLLRTAEVAGLHGVILPRRRAAQVTPAVASASSGASEHLLVAQVTNLVREMKHLKEADLWIAGLEDVPEAQLLWQADLKGALAVVVGSEGEGMRRLVREACDFLVRLPMRGQINSLNAAVAGSVALYEVARQRWL